MFKQMNEKRKVMLGISNNLGKIRANLQWESHK